MEYEIIKLLRELQLMRYLNKLNQLYFPNNKNCFVPAMLDIVCIENYNLLKKSLKEIPKNDLSQICVVMEYIETDLD